MKPSLRILIYTTLMLTAVRGASPSVDAWSAAVRRAGERHQPFPAWAAELPQATERMAYDVQRQVLAELVAEGDPVVGHKAGLTSEAAQVRWGAFEPVAGSLRQSQIKHTATFVSQRGHAGMVVEMELGFELKLSIRTEPRSVAELRSKVRGVVPVVELPNPDFEPADQVTVMDVIATNVAAATVIKGRLKPLAGLDVNAVEAELSRDGEVVATGTGADAMGDQWEALLWLVRNRLREGHPVRRNDLLITGALGKVVTAERGRYVADFGKLGRVTFTTR